MSFGNELHDFVTGFSTGFHMRDRNKDRAATAAYRSGFRNPKDMADEQKVIEGGGSDASTSRARGLPEGTGGEAASYSTNTIDDPVAGGVLGFIRQHEAGGDYNVIQGGKKADLSNMTISQVYNLQDQMKARGQESTAVGGYQTIQSTLKGVVSQLGFDPNTTKFTPQVQDQIGYKLLQNRGWNNYKNGKWTPDQIMDNLADEWAALPKASGKSAYEGVGSNRATASRDQFASLFKAPVQATSESSTPASQRSTALPTGGVATPGQPLPTYAPGTPMSQVADDTGLDAQGNPLPPDDPNYDPNYDQSQGYASGGAVAPAPGVGRVFTQAVTPDTPAGTPTAPAWTPRRVGDPLPGNPAVVNPSAGIQQKFRDMLAAEAAAKAANATSAQAESVDPSRFGHQAYIDAQAEWARSHPMAGAGTQPIAIASGANVGNKGQVYNQQIPAFQPQAGAFMSEQQWQASQPGYADWYKATTGKDAPAVNTNSWLNSYGSGVGMQYGTERAQRQSWLDNYYANTFGNGSNASATGMASGGMVKGYADGGGVDDEMQYDDQGRPIGLPPPGQPPLDRSRDTSRPPLGTPAQLPGQGIGDQRLPTSPNLSVAAPPEGTASPAPDNAEAGVDAGAESSRRRAALGDPAQHADAQKLMKEAQDRLVARDKAYTALKADPSVKKQDDSDTGKAYDNRQAEAQALGPKPDEPAAPRAEPGVDVGAEDARRRSALPPPGPPLPVPVDPSRSRDVSRPPLSTPAPLPGQGVADQGVQQASPNLAVAAPPQGTAARTALPTGAPLPGQGIADQGVQQASPNLAVAAPPPGTAAPAPDISIDELRQTVQRQLGPNADPHQVEQMAAQMYARLRQGGPAPTALPSPNVNARTPSGAAPTPQFNTDPDTMSVAGEQPAATPLPPPRPTGDASGNLGTPADVPAAGATPTSAPAVTPTQRTQSKPRTRPLVEAANSNRPQRQVAQGATFNDATPERPGALVKNPQDYKPGGPGRANAGPGATVPGAQREAIVKPAETQTSVKAGLDYIQKNILSPPRGAALGADPNAAAAQQKFDTNDHGLTSSQYNALAKQVDPEGKLPEAERVLKVQQDLYDFYMARGYPQKAAGAAASVMMYGRRVSQLSGTMAQAAAEKGDLVGAANWMAKAYETMPDGKELRVDNKLTNENGQPALRFQIVDLDTGKVETDDTATTDDMVTMAKKMQSGAAWFADTMRVAQGLPRDYRRGGGGFGSSSQGRVAQNQQDQVTNLKAMQQAAGAFQDDPSDENRKAYETARNTYQDTPGMKQGVINTWDKRLKLDPQKETPASRAADQGTKAAQDRAAALKQQADDTQDPDQKARLMAQSQFENVYGAAYEKAAAANKKVLPGKDISAAVTALDPKLAVNQPVVESIAKLLARGNPQLDGGTAVQMAVDAITNSKSIVPDEARGQFVINSGVPVYMSKQILDLLQQQRLLAKNAAP